jgi:anthranilate synthase/aminodeoxychorismate synthase-like glutamine amidotransferase
MLLMIDNYDSFTYNVVQALGELGAAVDVRRNDAIDPAAALDLQPAGLLISPGPGTPADAGVSAALIEAFTGRVPILGICLGHQTIIAAHGGTIRRADRVMHGKTSPVFHDGRTIYAGLGTPFEATRYHSLIAEEADLPDCLEIAAYTADGEIMGVRHREHPVEGVQFHPESIMTREGGQLLGNWLQGCRTTRGVV